MHQAKLIKTNMLAIYYYLLLLNYLQMYKSDE